MPKKLLVPATVSVLAAGLFVLAQTTADGSDVRVAHPDHGEPLASYPELLNSLKNGAGVAVTIEFPRCTAADTGAPGPAFAGGLRINAFLAAQDQYIAFSDVHQTLDPANHPVTEDLRYRVTPDDVVTLTNTTLGADARVVRESRYRCPMGSGASFTRN